MAKKSQGGKCAPPPLDVRPTCDACHLNPTRLVGVKWDETTRCLCEKCAVLWLAMDVALREVARGEAESN